MSFKPLIHSRLNVSWRHPLDRVFGEVVIDRCFNLAWVDAGSRGVRFKVLDDSRVNLIEYYGREVFRQPFHYHCGYVFTAHSRILRWRRFFLLGWGRWFFGRGRRFLLLRRWGGLLRRRDPRILRFIRRGRRFLFGWFPAEIFLRLGSPL